MNETITATYCMEWKERTPRLYTVSWKDPNGELSCKEHLPLRDVEDLLDAFEESNDYHTNPVITDIRVVSEF